jgi:DNA-binding response OmpR family regulator
MTAPEEGTVLLVEDEVNLAESYASILEREYTVRIATSGSAGLAKADDEVNVVLLDRRMPGMSGDELLATLVEEGISAKVAMLTAVEPEASVVEMPFDDYITKPIEDAELLALVDVLLRRAAYDERSQEFFRLAAKKATLETAGKEHTAEYEQLTDRLQALQAEVDRTLEELSTRDAFIDIRPTPPSIS